MTSSVDLQARIPNNVDLASDNLTAALTKLRSESQTLSANLSTVQIRQDFTKAMINTLTTGADGLTLADSNEEGANLLALQTRQQLSTTALSLKVFMKTSHHRMPNLIITPAQADDLTNYILSLKRN